MLHGPEVGTSGVPNPKAKQSTDPLLGAWRKSCIAHGSSSLLDLGVWDRVEAVPVPTQAGMAAPASKVRIPSCSQCSKITAPLGISLSRQLFLLRFLSFSYGYHADYIMQHAYIT